MNNIKQFRIAKGITQEQLGNVCGLKKTTICKWETGNSNPDIETLITLSKYFNCTIDDLVLPKTDTTDTAYPLPQL